MDTYYKIIFAILLSVQAYTMMELYNIDSQLNELVFILSTDYDDGMTNE